MPEHVHDETARSRRSGAGRGGGGIGWLGWLLAPAPERPRAQEVGGMVLRVLLGLMWLYNVSWKNAPNFGEDSGGGLYKFTSYAVEHPVFPPFSWLVENAVLPAFEVFGWAVLLVETLLAVLLLTGAWVRLAALLGVAQSLAIGLSVAAAPDEWPWSYLLMIGAHLVLLLGASGRVFAVDTVRDRPGAARRLGTIWGVVAVLMGLYSILTSLSEPLAARGTGLSLSNLSISLGTYNVVGGLVLGVIGVLLLVAALVGGSAARAGAVGGVLALVAGLLLHVRLTLGADPLLGGSEIAAAFFFAVGLVAAIVGRATLGSPAPASPVPDRAHA